MSMDYLLKADDQSYVSKCTNFRGFMIFAQQYKEEMQDTSANNNFFKEKVNKAMMNGISEIMDVSDLRTICFNAETDDSIARNQMMSQKILTAENSRRRNAQYKSIALRDRRYDHIDLKALARKSPYLYDEKNCEVQSETADVKKEIDEEMFYNEQMDYSKLIASVSIYFGYPRELEYHEIRLGRLMKVTDRVELTGEHTFEDLKNSFSCPADFVFTEDASEKDPTIEAIAKKKYPSSMFFVHDTFYVDNESNETALLIQNWAKRHGSIGQFHTALMSTKLGDISCRLGQPYVYIHQGVCEHLVVFTDLFLRDESHRNVTFPRRLIEKNFRRIACDCCKEQSAKWMILEHEGLMPNCPGYACTDCYQELCFDKNTGEKVCSFKAVPYCDRKEIGDGGKFLEELRFQKTPNAGK